MRGGQAERAGFPKFIEDGDAERAALFRIGGAAEFVEQNETIGRDSLEHLLHMEQMAREAGQAFGDRLLVADIGQHVIEQWKLGFGAGDGNGGMSHKREQAGGFHSDGLAAGIWAADQETALRIAQLEGDRNNRLILLTQDRFEQRMPRFAENEACAVPG